MTYRFDVCVIDEDVEKSWAICFVVEILAASENDARELIVRMLTHGNQVVDHIEIASWPLRNRHRDVV